jgi:hypothetical protein
MKSAPERSIFRESALKKYLQRQEQGILLRVASPPIILFFWVALLFLLGAGGLAWSIQVPISVRGEGVVLEQGAAGQGESSVVAVFFFSLDHLADLHVGQPATVIIGSIASNLHGRVENVEASAISPNEARSRFNLQGGLTQVITEPSITVTVSIGPAASMRIYAGSLCDAQIQVGSRSVFSLLPGFNHILGK